MFKKKRAGRVYSLQFLACANYKEGRLSQRMDLYTTYQDGAKGGHNLIRRMLGLHPSKQGSERHSLKGAGRLTTEYNLKLRLFQKTKLGI